MKYSIKQIIKRTDKHLKKSFAYKNEVYEYGEKNVSVSWDFIPNGECGNEEPEERFLIQFSIRVTYKDEFNFHIQDSYCECTNTMTTYVDTAWIYFKSDLGYKR
jgi:hypothetical protein